MLSAISLSTITLPSITLSTVTLSLCHCHSVTGIMSCVYFARYMCMYIICLPFISNRCPAPEFCPCTKFTPTGEDTGDLCYRDYQEIKVQEHVQMLDIGTIPRSLWVVLEDDLVDGCKPGDDVTVT